jgi:deazaflavin-dependent oxidoreductase (nitroreductase family)
MIAFFNWFGKLHQRIYELNGSLGRRFAWIPCLVLTTTGRRTGQQRNSVLVYADDPVDGATSVVVASNGGSDRPPAWLLNLQADPAVHVQVGNEHYDATARVVTPDDADYVRLWKLVNSINGNRYDGYQAKTTRPIAMVALTRPPAKDRPTA